MLSHTLTGSYSSSTVRVYGLRRRILILAGTPNATRISYEYHTHADADAEARRSSKRRNYGSAPRQENHPFSRLVSSAYSTLRSPITFVFRFPRTSTHAFQSTSSTVENGVSTRNSSSDCELSFARADCRHKCLSCYGCYAVHLWWHINNDIMVVKGIIAQQHIISIIIIILIVSAARSLLAVPSHFQYDSLALLSSQCDVISNLRSFPIPFHSRHPIQINWKTSHCLLFVSNSSERRQRGVPRRES